jgi:hydantoinase/carbamoylase family amidase
MMRPLVWSPERLCSNLKEFAQIGQDPAGGITRLSFSDSYQRAAARFAAKLQNAGLRVHQDPLGNVIGIRQGRLADRVIMTGSHLDTVKHGGSLDGALGTLAALEYVEALQDQHIELDHTLMVVAFAAEEGGPFGGTFGSRAMMGAVDTNDPNLTAKLMDAGIEISDITGAQMDTEGITAYLELHIEQGDFLHFQQIPLGVVTGIVGILRLEIIISGEPNHSGTTLMHTRRDAVTAFAELVGRANAVISAKSGLVGTFGVVDVFPNMANIIPGQVRTVLELRHMDREVVEETVQEISALAAQIPKVEITFRTLIDKPACECSTGIRKYIETTCDDLRIPYLEMASGAGHDANALATRIPVGMIFVPSIGGKSHCPEEATHWSDIQTGCQVYFETLLKLDAIPEHGCSRSKES